MLPPLLGDLQRAFRVSLLDVLAVANAMYLVLRPGRHPRRLPGRPLRLPPHAGRGRRRLRAGPAAGGRRAQLRRCWPAGWSCWAFAPACTTRAGCRCCRAGWPPASAGGPSASTARAATSARRWPRPGPACSPPLVGWRFGFAAAAVLSLACAVLALGLAAAEAAAAPIRGPIHPRAAGAGQACPARAGTHPARLLAATAPCAGCCWPCRQRLRLPGLPHLPAAAPGRRSAGGGLGASYLMSVVLVAGIIAQRFGGELADRRPRERLFLAEAALLAPVLVLLALTPGAAGGGRRPVFGFCWALAQPVANALTAAYARHQRPRPALRHPVRRHLRAGLVRHHRGGLFSPGAGPGWSSWVWRRWPSWVVCPWPRCWRSVSEPHEISRPALVR